MGNMLFYRSPLFDLYVPAEVYYDVHETLNLIENTLN